MVVQWRQVLCLLPLIPIVVLVIFEDRVSIPSCAVAPDLGQQYVEEDHPDDLKVMMVANLLLLGSEAGYTNILFRDYYLSRFFAVYALSNYFFPPNSLGLGFCKFMNVVLPCFYSLFIISPTCKCKC